MSVNIKVWFGRSLCEKEWNRENQWRGERRCRRQKVRKRVEGECLEKIPGGREREKEKKQE